MESLSAQEQALCYFAAQGNMNQQQIAEAVNLSPGTVGQKLKSERIQFEIKHLRYKLYGKDHKKRFQDILPHAIDVVEDVITNPNTKQSIRFAAAQEIMDRALGKPKQTVEHEGSLIRSLFDRLDAKPEEPKPIDVTPIENEVPRLRNPNGQVEVENGSNPNLKEDKVDKWIRENF